MSVHTPAHNHALSDSNRSLGNRPTGGMRGPFATVRTEACCRGAAYAGALVVALGIAYHVARIPVQVSDCLGNMLQIQHETWRHLIVNQFSNAGYLRPLLWAQIKGAYDLAHGHYWLTFKAIHAVQLLLTTVLFVRLLRVRTVVDLSAVPLALAVLIGMHTFAGTVREAFPVNSYLTIIVCTLAVANLAIAPHRWWHDALAAVLFAVSVLTVESGLLVFGAIVAGRLAGLRGISRSGVAAAVLIAVGYFYLRFAVLAVGTPSLTERSSGFGFEVLGTSELQARFGADPMLFYVYNIVSSLFTVFLSEPRAGVWDTVRRLLEGDPLPPWLVVNLVASVAASTAIGWWAVRRAPVWWRRQATDDDRLGFVAFAVVVGNAVLSFAYTKDVIMSAGGTFFAVLVYLAVRDLLQRWHTVSGRPLALVLCAVLAVTWAVRATALPHLLRKDALGVKNDWATVYDWLHEQHIDLVDEDARLLVWHLRRQALSTPVPVAPGGALREFLDVD